MSPTFMRIAHFSDIHFFHPYWGLSSLVTKRVIGNLNGLFNRGRKMHPNRAFSALDECEKLGVTHIMISGDLTTTASPAEYTLAQIFVEEIEERGMKAYLVPGNHDCYTRFDERDRTFFQYFPISDGSVYHEKLNKKWHLVGLDTTISTASTSARGDFNEQREDELLTILAKIPQSDSIILMNHFPLFAYEMLLRTMKGCERLQKIILEQKNIEFYLHGHAHRSTIADLRANGFPVVLDAGALTANSASTWNLIDLETPCVTLFQWQNGEWLVRKKHELV
ncbi:MAG: metallophosphoesterase [Simkaniaceae bacterium]|nr:metallophosphoesterase [Simkaniaceae bacterium]